MILVYSCYFDELVTITFGYTPSCKALRHACEIIFEQCRLDRRRWNRRKDEDAGEKRAAVPLVQGRKARVSGPTAYSA